jgi:hypothetical protein
VRSRSVEMRILDRSGEEEPRVAIHIVAVCRRAK